MNCDLSIRWENIVKHIFIWHPVLDIVSSNVPLGYLSDLLAWGGKFPRFQVMASFKGGGRVEPPGRWWIFENLQTFIKKIAKIALVKPIFKWNLNTKHYIFAGLDKKHNCLGYFWENCENFWSKFNRQIEFLTSF